MFDRSYTFGNDMLDKAYLKEISALVENLEKNGKPGKWANLIVKWANLIGKWANLIGKWVTRN